MAWSQWMHKAYAAYDEAEKRRKARNLAAVSWAYPGGAYTFDRDSVALYQDANDDWIEAAADVLRIDPDGNLILEKAATNQTRNSHAVGGTTGVNPTNWTHFAGGGLTYTRLGLATIDGIQCFGFRLNGTTSGANGLSFRWEANNVQVGAAGDLVTSSVFIAMTAGSTANFGNMRLNIVPYNATVELTAGIQYGDNNMKTGLNADLQRWVFNHTTGSNEYGTLPANTTHYRGALEWAYPSGVAIDITVWVGLPQDEHVSGNNLTASSPIRTTGTAATRAADMLTPSLPLTGLHDFVVGYAAGGSTTYDDIVAPFTLDPATLTRPLVSTLDWRAP